MNRRRQFPQTSPCGSWPISGPSWAPAPWVTPGLGYPGYSGGLGDPEQDHNSADLEDPEQDHNAADLEDPNRRAAGFFPPFAASFPYGYGSPGPWPIGCCCCPSESGAAVASSQLGMDSSREYSGFIMARLVPGVEPDGYDDLHQLAVDKRLKGLQAVLELDLEDDDEDDEREAAAEILPSWPLIRNREVCGVSIYERLRELEQQAATTGFPPLHSLTSYWRIDLRQHPEKVGEVLERLNGLAVVDYAWRELAASEPYTGEDSAGDFSEEQDYLDDAPVGIGARWAWDWLPATAAKNVTCCDLEQRWAQSHQNLPSLKFQADLVFGDNLALDDKKPGHGTAVCGQLIAESTAFSKVEGIAARVAKLKLASHYDRVLGFNGHVAEAIANVIGGTNVPSPVLQAGDLLILEVQRSYLPTETDDADFDAIRLASALGIIVFEAAGNGSFDLDGYTDPRGRRVLARGAAGFRDSGAILVGAAYAALPHNRASSSNHGARIDVYGWGNDVFTCGYGDFYQGGGESEYLTDTFSGTSAATPLAAGAGALLQAVYKYNVDPDSGLTPIRMREILSDPQTGTPQGPGVPGHIGVMPDLCKILRDGLGMVPSPYMRQSPCDDGVRPACCHSSCNHWSSPDIFVRRGSTFPQSHLSGGAKEYAPAPGLALVPAKKVNVFARVKNRGLGVAERVRIRFFYSEPATLITPEMWHLIGETEMQSVPQGEIITPSSPLPWTPPNIKPSHFSFLAVLAAGTQERCEVPPLPCGPPYFDWETYRSFLCADHVVCRNVHKLPVKAGKTPTAGFLLTGAPDSARRFDFEIVQKLPKGVKATLQLPPLVTLKLRRKLPWTTNDRPGILALPAAPRILFKSVRLTRGACHKATLTLKGALDKLQTGHCFIVRQLFRGEEVGRITWYLDRSEQ